MNAGERASPRSGRGGGSGRMNPIFIGIMIGLLLGVGMAVGLALWLNRSANPFVEKSKPVDALATRAARPDNVDKTELPKLDPAKPGIGQLAPPVAVKDGTEKPRFEFYKILPGDKGERGAKGSDKSTAPATDTKRDKPADATVAGKEIYMLQAGAFQNESDAENLKAKIAFAGMEATVKPVNLPEKGTLYRVRLGPYRSVDEVNRVKTALSQNGISAAVVKPE
jgi:cell division protein FtsN